MVMSWEQGITHAAWLQSFEVMSKGSVEQIIPQQSIRLRILANSDQPADQWLKKYVRDAVIAEVNNGLIGLDTIEQARMMIRAQIPQMEDMINQKISDAGFKYEAKIELARVPFPTKVYGNRIYPAGEYEALRIILGAGEGKNWWCVLFPPLCFVGVAVQPKPSATEDEQKIEYRFFLIDWAKKWWDQVISANGENNGNENMDN